MKITLEVRNIAQAANPCLPSDLCYLAMGGEEEADLYSWEQSMNCGHQQEVGRKKERTQQELCYSHFLVLFIADMLLFHLFNPCYCWFCFSNGISVFVFVCFFCCFIMLRVVYVYVCAVSRVDLATGSS